jgi:hypothetical protein
MDGILGLSLPTLTLAQLMQRLVALLAVLAVHGAVAAAIADRLGDPGPRHDGRRTPSPLPHLDVVGFVHGLFFAVVWMRPLDVDPGRLRGGWRGALAMTAGASAALAAVSALLLLARPWILPLLGDSASYAVGGILNAAADVAIVTAIVHLLPLPPFVGAAWAPWAGRLGAVWTGARLRWILVALVALASLTGVTPRAVDPIASAWRSLLGY